MNKKIFCANCGEEMFELYTKQGMKVYLCPHVVSKNVNNRIGMPSHALVYCRRKVFGLKEAFYNMTADSDLNLCDLTEATENKIDEATLLKLANLALELDVEPEVLPAAFNSVMTLGYSLGRTPENSIESLVYGIGNKSRRRLDNIGIIVIAEQAYKWYQDLNKIKRPLTETERDKAWNLYAIHQTIEKAKMVKGEN